MDVRAYFPDLGPVLDELAELDALPMTTPDDQQFYQRKMLQWTAVNGMDVGRALLGRNGSGGLWDLPALRPDATPDQAIICNEMIGTLQRLEAIGQIPASPGRYHGYDFARLIGDQTDRAAASRYAPVYQDDALRTAMALLLAWREQLIRDRSLKAGNAES